MISSSIRANLGAFLIVKLAFQCHNYQSMNVKIMNDSMGILQHNEQKATTRVKTKVVVESDWFQQIANDNLR
jgi:hypothetical protein